MKDFYRDIFAFLMFLAMAALLIGLTAYRVFAAPSYATITGTVVRGSGAVCAGCNVTFRVPYAQPIGGQTIAAGIALNFALDANGAVPSGKEIAQTLIVEVSIDKNPPVLTTIPSSASVNLSSLVTEPIALPANTSLNSLDGVLSLEKGGTNNTTWTASRCVQTSSDGSKLESASAACGSGGGGGDSITVNSSAATDPDFLNGDIDWTLSGGNSITATVACTGCVDATDLAADSVDSSEIAADAVGTSEIATDGVGSAEIAADAVGTSEIATDGVGNAEIADSAVQASEIATGAVGTSEIADGVVAYSDANSTATLAGDPAFGASSVWLATTGLIWEGATSNTSEGLLIAADVDADRTWTLPNQSGTFAVAATAPLAISATGTATCAVASGSQAGCLSSTDWTTFNNKQPAGTYSDITGTPANNQIAVWTDSNTLEGAAELTFTSSVLTIGDGSLGGVSISSNITSSDPTLDFTTNGVDGFVDCVNCRFTINGSTTIPDGDGASNSVAYWSDSNSLTDDTTDFSYNSTTNTLTVANLSGNATTATTATTANDLSDTGIDAVLPDIDGTGLSINTATTPDELQVATTELTGNRTWGNNSDASIAWTYDLSGTDVVVTFSSANTSFSGTLQQAGVGVLTTATGQPLDADLTALAALSTTGIMARTAANTYTMRSVAEGLAIDLTNGDGVSGNPTVAFDPTELTGNRTWGDGVDATAAWTFSLSGATDPVVTFKNNEIDITTDQYTLGSGSSSVVTTYEVSGSDPSITASSSAFNFNSAELIGSQASSGNLTLGSTSDSTKGDIALKDSVLLWTNIPDLTTGNNAEAMSLDSSTFDISGNAFFSVLKANTTTTLTGTFSGSLWPFYYGLDFSPTISIAGDAFSLTGQFAVNMGGTSTTTVTGSLSEAGIAKHRRTYTTSQVGGAYILQNAFILDNVATYEQTGASGTQNLLSQYSLYHRPIYKSDGGNPSGLTVGADVGHYQAGTYSASTGNTVTITARSGLTFTPYTTTGAGTVTVADDTAVTCGALSGATATACVKSAVTAGTGKYFLNDTGGAVSRIAGDTIIGSTSATPSATLHVTEDTVGREALRIESVATNSDPNYKIFFSRATAAASSTTNIDFPLATAAPTDKPCPDDSVCLVEARTVCHCTSGSSCTTEMGGGNISSVVAKSDAGTISIQGAVSTQMATQIGSSSLTSITLSLSGNNARVAVVVPANFNHTCHVTWQISSVQT